MTAMLAETFAEGVPAAGAEKGRLAFQEFDIFIYAMLVPEPFPLRCVTA